MSKQLPTKTTIRNLAAEIKKTLAPVRTAANAAIKSLAVDGNTVNFYTSADKSGDAAFSVDFPTEMFLDQTKTAFVPQFAFSAEAYPGATDPQLDGKPVMVLAVKGENPDSCTYSFLSMAALVDTYKAKTAGKDASTTVTVGDYEIDVKVNLSAAEGNALVLKDDGLFVDKSGFVAAEDGKRLMTDAEGEKLAGIAEGATKTAASATNGLMTAADKKKLDGIANSANAYSLPTATSSVLDGVKTGSNITNSSGTLSVSKANVTSALGYTPANASHTHNYAGSSSAGGTANSVNGYTFGAQTSEPGAGSALTTGKLLIVYV